MQSQNRQSLTQAIAVSALLMCAISANVSADEDYAHPSGEDHYGTTYNVDEIPSEMRAVLDEYGEYEIPSFINRTIYRGEEEYWVIEQIPEAGTIVSCPQTVEVELKHTNDDGDERWATLPIELIDVTRPDIFSELIADDDPHVSFGGILRYPGHAEITPIIAANDPCGIDEFEIRHNGEPYQFGATVSGIGLHTMSVEAVDTSGNIARETIFFEIRERPSHTAIAVVEETESVLNDDGEVESLEMTVLIASDEFYPEDMLLSSVRLMLVDSDGRWMNPEPITIRDAFEPGCVELQYEQVAASVEKCNVRAEFIADFSDAPLPASPSYIDLLGVAHINGELTHEWGAHTANVPVPDPYQQLAADAYIQPVPCDPGPCEPDDPECDPEPEPPVECEFVEELYMLSDDCNHEQSPVPHGCLDHSYAESEVLATTVISGESTSYSAAKMDNVCTTASQCEGDGVAYLLVNFVGNCCICSVTFSASATVWASTDVYESNDAMASADASGEVRIQLPCEELVSANASASTPMMSQLADDDQDATGPVSCTVDGCQLHWMAVASEGEVETEAYSTSKHVLAPDGGADPEYGIAEGQASTISSVGSIDASPSITDCDDCEEHDDCDPCVHGDPVDP